jgi:hypothetical protein
MGWFFVLFSNLLIFYWLEKKEIKDLLKDKEYKQKWLKYRASEVTTAVICVGVGTYILMSLDVAKHAYVGLFSFVGGYIYLFYLPQILYTFFSFAHENKTKRTAFIYELGFFLLYSVVMVSILYFAKVNIITDKIFWAGWIIYTFVKVITFFVLEKNTYPRQ